MTDTMSDKMATALIMFRRGGLEPARYAAALSATVEETGLSEETVADHWRELQRLVSFNVAHGDSVLKTEPADKDSMRSDDPSMIPLWHLYSGGIGPLTELLEKETGQIHPLLERELASLLRGTNPNFRLELKRSGKGSPKRRTAEDAKRDRDIVAFLDNQAKRSGRTKPGIGKVAIGAAAKKFGVSDRYVQRAVKSVADGNARLISLMRGHFSRQ